MCEPAFPADLPTAPKARILHASVPLRRSGGTWFTLEQSKRHVPMRRVDSSWLACGPVRELGADDRVVLDQLVDDIEAFDMVDMSALSAERGERHRLVLEVAFCFAAERDASRRSDRALRRLRRAGLVVAVYHHVLLRDGDDEFVCRIQREVPTMRAWSAGLSRGRRELLECFWRARVDAGHVWDGRRHSISKAVRSYVLERDGHRCQSHGRRYRALRCSVGCRPEVDHILAIARGGEDHAENLQVLCSWCNSAKRNHDATHRHLPLLQLTASAAAYRSPTGGILQPKPPGEYRTRG